MLSPEALRLVTIEILCPTAALSGTEQFPTLAGRRVFDSREAAMSDLDIDREYTPVISVYTVESSNAPRGEAAGLGDISCIVTMDLVAELVQASADGDGEFAFAMAEGDPQARLVLAALCAKIRFLLEFSEKGRAWRRLAGRVLGMDATTFAVPDIGLRLMRVTMRYRAEVSPDDFDSVNGGLPEPIASVLAELPAGSYAKAKLLDLAQMFIGELPDTLATIAGTANLPGATDITIGAGNLG
jgi:hypothetical protein